MVAQIATYLFWQPSPHQLATFPTKVGDLARERSPADAASP
jgi:hypothetical protein